MTPTIHDHRMTASAWQTVPLTQRCEPPGTTSPPDKKTCAAVAQHCEPPGTTSPPDKKIEQSERIARDRSRVFAVAQA